MFAVTVLFDIHPGQMDAFLPRMIDNARTSRDTEPGCQLFDVCQEVDQVFLYVIYDDRAAFDVHLASAHFKAFDAAVAPMVARKDVQTYERVLR